MFFYIHGYPRTVDEMGPVADMPLIQAVRYLIDHNVFGEYPKNSEWYEHLSSVDFLPITIPNDACGMAMEAYSTFKRFESHCIAKLQNDTLTREDRDQLKKLLDDYKMMLKLTA